MHKEPLAGDDIFVVHDFLTPEECAALVERSEREGYQEATVNTPLGPMALKDLRDNARLVADDPALAAALWQRAQPLLPQQIAGWEAVGFNERWRFYRYDPGQNFAPHYDGSFRRDSGEESKLTFLVYLNDDFTGGTTDFYQDDDGNDDEDTLRVRVFPKRGMALVFAHRQLHEGAAVERGRKYVLRTDVMYARGH